MTEAITLSWMALLPVIPVMIFAGLVHGALGLGFPLVATPIIAVFVDVRLAIVITLLPTAVVNMASITSQHSFRSVVVSYLPLAMASLAGALVGSTVLALTAAEIFRLLLAMLIVIFLWTQFRGSLPFQLHRFNRTAVLIVVGLLAGFSAGTTNVMVAILLIYFLSVAVPRPEMVTAMNLCFLIGKVSQIVVFLYVGLLTSDVLVKTAPLAIVAFASLLAGQRIGDRIPQQTYRIWLRVLLAVLAAILFTQYFIQ